MVTRVPLKSYCTAGQALANAASEWADSGFWGDLHAVHLAAVQSSCLCTALPSKHVRHKPCLSLVEVAQSTALCRDKEHSLAAQILKMSGTQHGNKMVFPNGNHATDLMCLLLNYTSHDSSFRAVCSYQMNYWLSNNMRGCITFWIIISLLCQGGLHRNAV